MQLLNGRSWKIDEAKGVHRNLLNGRRDVIFLFPAGAQHSLGRETHLKTKDFTIPGGNLRNANENIRIFFVHWKP